LMAPVRRGADLEGTYLSARPPTPTRPYTQGRPTSSWIRDPIWRAFFQDFLEGEINTSTLNLGLALGSEHAWVRTHREKGFRPSIPANV